MCFSQELWVKLYYLRLYLFRIGSFENGTPKRKEGEKIWMSTMRIFIFQIRIIIK